MKQAKKRRGCDLFPVGGCGAPSITSFASNYNSKAQSRSKSASKLTPADIIMLGRRRRLARSRILQAARGWISAQFEGGESDESRWRSANYNGLTIEHIGIVHMGKLLAPASYGRHTHLSSRRLLGGAQLVVESALCGPHCASAAEAAGTASRVSRCATVIEEAEGEESLGTRCMDAPTIQCNN